MTVERLNRAIELDKQFRHVFKGLGRDDLIALCAVVSVAAWELRGYAEELGDLPQAEIIAAYVCRCRGIDGYPLAGLP